jgi:predicted phosphodiesterase
MRYLVLSDIHGNAHALRAVLDSVADDGIEHVLCLGDVIGYGPFPNECVDTMRTLRAITVIGNHELLVLDRLSDERSGQLARRTTAWTRSALTTCSREHIAGLPGRTRVADVVLAHGAPDDPEEYVRSPDRGRQLLDWLGVNEPGSRFLLLGHTHRPWAFGSRSGNLLRGPRTGVVELEPTQHYLLNPGSVGQSRDRTVAARFLVLDTARNEAAFRCVRYDVRGHVEALRREGLPAGSHHMTPNARDRARRVVRTVRRQTDRIRSRT